MNIAFCFDKSYAVYYLVTMVSLFENNQDAAIKVYLITPGLSESVKNKFLKLGSIYNQTIIFCDIPDDMFSGLPIYPPYNKATYFRYMIPALCKESKIIQLDGDIIVRKSLQPLWNINVDEYAMAVVEDQCSDDILLKNRLCVDTAIFNNGVQLMNLDYWRKNNISQQCINFLLNNPDKCVFMDQDANNVILQGKIRFLPYTYNMQGAWYILSNDKIKMHRDKIKEIVSYKDDPVIVHYSTIKPWFKECPHPFKSEFEMYARRYDFIGYKERYMHSMLYRLGNRIFMTIKLNYKKIGIR